MTLLALVLFAIISLLAAASTADSAAMAQRADHEWSERYENGREKRQIGEGGKL
jgi:type II secretory pathway component PulJ